jgi:hypothetical protein
VIRQCDASKLPRLVPYLCCISALLASPRAGHGEAPQRGEVQAVVRISKQLLDDAVSRKEISATVPYNAVVLGFHVQGVAEGRAKLDVELTTHQGDATFIVLSQGSAQTYARGVRGPFVASGPAWAPIASRSVLRFDGRRFSLVQTTPWAQVHGELASVEGRHGRHVGRAVGRVVRPLGQLLIPRAEAEATPIGEWYLKNFVDELAGKIIERLNRTTRVEESLNRLFPETKDWGFVLSTDANFIQAAYGPPGSEAPDLPDNPGRLENARLELWLRSTTKGAAALAELSKSPLAKQLIQRYLEATLPELAALTEERSVSSVGPWLVISIGAPKAE